MTETQTQDQSVLDAVIDSWQRGNTILVNLLHLLGPDDLDRRAMDGSPSVVALFSHMQKVRLFWLEQTAPEFAEGVGQLFTQADEEQTPERDPSRIEQGLNGSARAVAEAVSARTRAGQPLRGPHAIYDQPLLLLQHLLWHEGYHVGQIKLALKAGGRVLSEPEEEGAIWSVWRTEIWP